MTKYSYKKIKNTTPNNQHKPDIPINYDKLNDNLYKI